MIATKGAARFHANGYSSPGHPVAAASQAMDIGGNPTVPNPVHGTKRLISCREELERSWQGTNVAPQDLHCISSASSSEDFTGSRVKRRRTHRYHYQSSDGSNDDMMMTEGGSISFVRGTRIAPSNRPPSSSLSKLQVKAGWYEGEVDAFGNRHGRGITKHDDGTEYEGAYVEDVMEGNGRYQFVTTRHLVPNPTQNGSHQLHRLVEKSFVGNFESDVPQGAGMIVTKTVDSAPQVLGSSPVDVRFVEVVYDVGVHRNSSAVGEGMRIIYTSTNAGGRSTLEMTCYRLLNGENTNLKVAAEYAEWMLTCMGVAFPPPPST